MIIEMKRAAAEVQGGVATIAAALKITREAIYQWRTVPPRIGGCGPRTAKRRVDRAPRSPPRGWARRLTGCTEDLVR